MAGGSPTTLQQATGLLLALALSSCTVAGGLAGAAMESQKPPSYRNWPATDRWRLAPGDNVRLHLEDGSRVEGRYLGTAGPTAGDPEVYFLVDVDQAVPVSAVSRIDIESPKTGWMLGGTLGLLLDSAVVAVVCAGARPTGSFGNLNPTH